VLLRGVRIGLAASQGHCVDSACRHPISVEPSVADRQHGIASCGPHCGLRRLDTRVVAFQDEGFIIELPLDMHSATCARCAADFIGRLVKGLFDRAYDSCAEGGVVAAGLGTNLQVWHHDVGRLAATDDPYVACPLCAVLFDSSVPTFLLESGDRQGGDSQRTDSFFRRVAGVAGQSAHTDRHAIATSGPDGDFVGATAVEVESQARLLQESEVRVARAVQPHFFLHGPEERQRGVRQASPQDFHSCPQNYGSSGAVVCTQSGVLVGGDDLQTSLSGTHIGAQGDRVDVRHQHSPWPGTRTGEREGEVAHLATDWGTAMGLVELQSLRSERTQFSDDEVHHGRFVSAYARQLEQLKHETPSSRLTAERLCGERGATRHGLGLRQWQLPEGSAVKYPLAHQRPLSYCYKLTLSRQNCPPRRPGDMRFFLSGIMRGSLPQKGMHGQDYRRQIQDLLVRHIPKAVIYDPLHDRPVDGSTEVATNRDLFFGHAVECASVDVLVAYLPAASMGTAIEMWEAYHHGVAVVCISPMAKNWTIRFLSHAIYPDLAAFEADLASGQLLAKIQEVRTSTGEKGDCRGRS